MDFGLAMVMEANPWYSSSHRQGGSLRWMAPELLLNGKQTRSCSSDVYSYGGVAFEVTTGEPPHHGRSDTEISLAVCDPNAPKAPFDEWARYPQVTEDIKEMITKCWSRRSEKRPTMRGIEERLGKLVP
ncbi:hypothetical protein FS837_012540 [Tulasnella sp. UAMH 9824]|nr:hypothetical protein FS837_012540 [Tulasnella sp. UAMH 9824]